jgi:hypothetical protein
MSERESVAAIRPEQAMELKIKNLPELMIEAANTLLLENLYGGNASFKIDDISKLLKSLDFDFKSLKDKSWVNTLAALYQSQGWKVEVRHPSYDDNFESYVSFSSAKRAQ